MRRTLLSLCLLPALASLPGATSAAPQPESAPLPDRQVNSRANPCVRLRSGAALDRTIVDCLEPGTRLRILGAVAGWSHVRLADGREGWVDTGYLELAPEPSAETAAASPLATPVEAAVEDPSASLVSQIATLEEQLQEMAATRDATEERLRKTVEAAEAAQTEAGQLRLRVKRLEEGTASNESAQAELTTLRKRVDQLEQEASDASGRLARAAALNAEQERRIESLDEALAAASAAQEESAPQLAAARDELQAAQQANVAHEARIGELESDLAAARDREAEARQALGEADERLQQAAARSAEQTRRNDELNRRLGRAQVKAAEMALEQRPPAPAEPAAKPSVENLVKVRAPIVSAPQPATVAVRQPAPPPEPAMPVEPEPRETSMPATEAAIGAVHAWAAAWSDQRVADYLSFYAPGFQPPQGLSRDAWEAQRRQRLSRPSYIRVTITALSAEATGESSVLATFGQEYESDTFADSVSKELVLTRVDDDWKILEERATP